MTDPSHVGRISEIAFKICLGFLLGLSTLVVAARILLRIKTRGRLFLDDGFLIFGLVSMCIATGLLYRILPIVYLQEAIDLEPERHSLPLSLLPELLTDFVIIDVYVVLVWTAEFSVKLSLLLFYWQLVDRLNHLAQYVRFVIAVTAIVWAVLICEPFITCPHFGVESLTKCTPTHFQLAVGLTILTVILDIVTDIMILSIPLLLLWNAQMRRQQKFGIVVFLTLNIWLIVIALIRASMFKRGNAFDLVWTCFFQCLESNIAILAASFSVFRSVFVKTGARHRHLAPKPTYFYRQRLFQSSPRGKWPLDNLPSIPEPMLMTLRGAIWRRNRSQYTANESNLANLASITKQEYYNAELDIEKPGQENNIIVKRDWPTESSWVRTATLFKLSFPSAEIGRLHRATIRCQIDIYCEN